MYVRVKELGEENEEVPILRHWIPVLCHINIPTLWTLGSQQQQKR
jgi:hypothetical protein